MKRFSCFALGKNSTYRWPQWWTDHGKTGCIVFTAVVVYHFGKAPVHLVGFSRLGRKPTATAALWRYQLPLGRDKVFVCLDIPLDGTEAALETNRLQPLQAYCRIGDTLTKQFVQVSRIATENSVLLFLTDKAMGHLVEVIRLKPSEPCPGHAGAAFQLRQIDLFQGEIISLLGLHFLYGL